MNVLFELETDGDEDIWTQELKLSEDTWKEPEQVVFEVLVVTEVVSIASEKVTEIDDVNDTNVFPFDGLVDETVVEGEVVYSSFSVQEITVRLKREMRIK